MCEKSVTDSLLLYLRFAGISYSFDAMGVFDNFILSVWCHSNQLCLQSIKEQMSSVRESASFFLGLISVVVWVVAEIPQIITNYRTKSTEGLSLTFLVTWIIG